MKSKLVIHIGLRKTGSSALQELLSENKKLLASHRIIYPERLTRFPAHQELAWCLMGKKPLNYDPSLPRDEIYGYYIKVIDEAQKSGSHVVLSSEDLSLLTFDYSALEYIKNRLGGYKPEIVYFARSPLSYHISNYKHAIIEGREKRSFADYVFNIDSLSYANARMMRGIWSSLFGADNIIIIPYEKKLLFEQGILRVFLKYVFDITIASAIKQHKSNQGITNQAVRYILALNRSELPDENIRKVKEVIRETKIDEDREDDFLREELNYDELRLLCKIYGLEM